MNNNQTAIIQLKLLGYPIVNIRRALNSLTDITQLSIAKNLNTSRQNVTHHINGRGSNDPKIQQGIADSFGVPVGDLFE
ncbi:hypothetical protein LCGC14_1630010 [marine sediment metagenome]|uniref:HTH cro/C1-type domain-containing protein n=1 Tax=marine sediment metagenome TaxID=412755 RepID=A0A0F9I322_9ZZZZ